jgi:arginyl-tRNA synthetase
MEKEGSIVLVVRYNRGSKKTTEKAVESFCALLNTKEEENLLNLLSQFPEKVEESAEHYRPYVIAKYLIELARHSMSIIMFTRYCRLRKE